MSRGHKNPMERRKPPTTGAPQHRQALSHPSPFLFPSASNMTPQDVDYRVPPGPGMANLAGPNPPVTGYNSTGSLSMRFTGLEGNIDCFDPDDLITIGIEREMLGEEEATIPKNVKFQVRHSLS